MNNDKEADVFGELVVILSAARRYVRKAIDFNDEHKEDFAWIMDDLHRWVYFGTIKSIEKKLGDAIRFVDAKYGKGEEQ